MSSNTETAPVSKKRLWAGRVISALPALFLLVDGVMKLVKPAPVVEATVRLGYPESVILLLGIVLITCTVLYLIPRTSILGAILLTGYLGGAVATHVRVGEGLFPIGFPIIFGVLIWGGLWLRDDRLRALIPLRRPLPASVVGMMLILALSTGSAAAQQLNKSGRGNEKSEPAQGRYASVNGLKMYYEIHGTGRPLVLLHGAFGWATVFPMLAKNRQVIAVELQGHGHTADIDRPLTYEQMADDTADLLKQLGIEQADVFGYSMGGNVGLALAIRHPKLVGKLAILGSHYGKLEDAYDPEVLKQFKSMSPDNFAPQLLKDPYDKMAPDPKQWPVLVAKIKKMGSEFKGFAPEDLKSIKASVLVMIGDRDVVRPEHAVEMFRLIPHAQLGVIAGGDHFTLFTSPEKVLSPIAEFLDAPMPKQNRLPGP